MRYEVEGLVVDPNNVFSERALLKKLGPLKKVFYKGSLLKGKAEEDKRNWGKAAKVDGYLVLVSWIVTTE